MEKKYLIVNLGSASKKYALYGEHKEIARIHFEKEGRGFVATLKDGRVSTLPATKQQYNSGVDFFLKKLLAKHIIDDVREITLAGIRIVAPGDFFMEVRPVDALYIKNLKSVMSLVPLHASMVFDELRELRRVLPRTRIFGISDSAFHKDLPEVAQAYAIPKISSEVPIRRYGYHGISLFSAMRTIRQQFHRTPKRIIICHLGSGASVTAIKDGKSIDTSMGFTPLEGVPMGTRPGDLDPGVVMYISKTLKLSLAELDVFLNTKSGLLGVSGETNDVRDLLAYERKGDKKSALALSLFAYRIKKYIGAFQAVLGGLDLLVFTGTIGERSWAMRERICEGLAHVGVKIDVKKNRQINGFGRVEKRGAKTTIAVVPTDEMIELFEELRTQK